MTSVRSTRSVLLVLGLILLTTMPACAQITSQTGAIRIIVVDPQGASVSDAKVALNSPLGTTATKETAADGSVVFPLLDPGSYKVTVERGGFRRAVVNSLAVKITEVTNLTVSLEVGEISTEIIVSGEAAQTVNTTNATLGETLTGDVVGNLPLFTRNFLFLLGNNAGTSASLPNATAAGRGSPVIFVDGQRGTNNNLVYQRRRREQPWQQQFRKRLRSIPGFPRRVAGPNESLRCIAGQDFRGEHQRF